MNLEERFIKSQMDQMKIGTLWVPPSGLAPQQEMRKQAMAEQFTGLADAAAGAVKGAVAGFAGLPGDILAIGRGLYEIGARGGDQSAADAFLKGLEEGTIVPTTERIGKWLDETVGPVVPPNQQSRVPTETRQKSAERGQMVGEALAPGGAATAVVKGAKTVGRTAKKAVKGAKNGD